MQVLIEFISNKIIEHKGGNMIMHDPVIIHIYHLITTHKDTILVCI